ncbi:MAG: leucine-rich repeat domain-containing protein [Planctomycetota bacterium]|jgi:Leucine-rich repeat (LRR) protein
MRTKRFFAFGLMWIVLGAVFVTTSKAYDNNESDKYAVVVDFPNPNLENNIRVAIGKAEDEIKNSDLFRRRFIVSNARSSKVKDLTGLEYWDKYAPTVNFPDPNLEKKIRAAIGKAEGEIKDIHLFGKGFIVFDARSSQIKDLTGLEYCTDLKVLRLAGNQFKDITPISGLGKLTDLFLGSKLTNANIVPLAKLTNLERLYLENNQITDMTPLAGLKKLSRLQIRRNQIADLSPLAALSNMESLWLGENEIIDIAPLAALTKLGGLSLSNNKIRDISPLAGLRNLGFLDISNNRLTDISQLTDLDKLAGLYLNNNQITDISSLSEIKNLTILELWRNQIEDITPLAGLPKLTRLDLHHNQISDLSSLSTRQ